MLTLSRKRDETVVIHDPESGRIIRVTIRLIDPPQVRLSFEADRDVEIWREEIWEKMESDR